MARFQRAQPPFREEAEPVPVFLLAPPPAKEGRAAEEAEAAGEAEEPETSRKPSPPEIVAEAVHEALFAARPKLRYLVGTRWECDRVLYALVAKLLGENDNPQHNYSRDRLVALLDRHNKERARA